MTTPSERRQVRVAIVGSGLTGLVATYILSAHNVSSSSDSNAPQISVEIFERAPTLGMDSASITVPLSPPSSTHTIATPAVSSPSPAHNDTSHASADMPRSSKRLKLQTQPLPTLPPPPTLAAEDEKTHDKRFLRIDVPMRAFTGGYPQLLALYRHLGVRTKKTNSPIHSPPSHPTLRPGRTQHGRTKSR